MRAGARIAMDPALAVVPAGHYYSPIPSAEARKAAAHRTLTSTTIPGVDIHTVEQLELINALASYYDKVPFSDRQGFHRYHYDNDMFGYTDAIIYATLLLKDPPSRVIEAGSGYTSALLLDMNDLVFERSIRATFIEPYPDRLRSLTRHRDLNGSLMEQTLQSVDLEVFEELSAGDILFIDSTHVAKVGSDVNYLLFEILPRLKPGVRVHLHDIFFPFEYPPEWTLRGVAWNEAYLLRAFLQYNRRFKILLWNHYLGTHHSVALNACMPMCARGEGGSIWLEAGADIP